MPNYKDITNQKFNRITAISYSHTDKKGDAYWNCICDCGKHFVAKGSSIRYGSTKSCGCLHKDFLKKGISHRIHGLSKTKIYKTLKRMKGRCYNKNSSDYKDYGKRGIEVCDEWLNSPIKFYNWAINNGWKDGLTIERIDNNGNYCPENCKWISNEKQALNRRTTTFVEKGICLKEYVKEHSNICIGTVYSRLSRGWELNDAIFKPLLRIRNNIMEENLKNENI